MIHLKFIDKDDNYTVAYKNITCHLIFNVKTDLISKARYVAGGYLTHPPQSINYMSGVSCNSLRLAFLIEDLNYLDILAGDIQNAYLNALTKEKVVFLRWL